jgi:hypothetical protein
MLIKDYWRKWVMKLIATQTSALLYLAAFLPYSLMQSNAAAAPRMAYSPDGVRGLIGEAAPIDGSSD